MHGTVREVVFIIHCAVVLYCLLLKYAAGFGTTAVPVVQKLTKDSIGTRNKDSEQGTW